MEALLLKVGVVACVPLGLYAWKGLALAALQNKLVYAPYWPIGERRQLNWATGRSLRLDVKEDFITSTGGARLQTWIVRDTAASRAPNDIHTTILYFHGNAGNLSHRFQHFRAILDAIPCGSEICAFSYRGYGLSNKSPSQPGLIDDGVAALNFALSHSESVPRSKRLMILYGHSLGGGVALHVANRVQKEDIDGVILENAFTSSADLVESWFPQWWLPHRHVARSRLNRSPWENLAEIRSISCPLLLIAGTYDEVVGNHAPRFQENATTAVSVEVAYMSKGLHETSFLRPGFRRALTAWHNRLATTRK